MEIIVSQKYYMVDLALIAEKAKEYIANAKSLRTREIYRICWRDFNDWCVSRGLSPLPASPETVVAFLIVRAQTLKISTLSLRLVSIRQAHFMAGYQFDKSHALITEAFKGIKKMHGAPQIAKNPILLEDLQGMLQQLGKDLQGIRDRALFLFGFTGAFRRSELVDLKVDISNSLERGLMCYSAVQKQTSLEEDILCLFLMAATLIHALYALFKRGLKLQVLHRAICCELSIGMDMSVKGECVLHPMVLSSKGTRILEAMKACSQGIVLILPITFEVDEMNRMQNFRNEYLRNLRAENLGLIYVEKHFHIL